MQAILTEEAAANILALATRGERAGMFRLLEHLANCGIPVVTATGRMSGQRDLELPGPVDRVDDGHGSPDQVLVVVLAWGATSRPTGKG